MLKVKETIQSVSSQYLDNIGSCNFQCKHGINESLFLEVLMMEIRGITLIYKGNIDKILKIGVQLHF